MALSENWCSYHLHRYRKGVIEEVNLLMHPFLFYSFSPQQSPLSIWLISLEYGRFKRTIYINGWLDFPLLLLHLFHHNRKRHTWILQEFDKEREWTEELEGKNWNEEMKSRRSPWKSIPSERYLTNATPTLSNISSPPYMHLTYFFCKASLSNQCYD